MAYNTNMYMPQFSGYSPQQNQMWTYQPTSTQPINGLVSVTGIEGAKAYQLPPNSSMPLFDGDQDVLYVKTTDAAGYPTIKSFKFQPVEHTETAAAGADYVQRSEFEQLVAQVKGLLEQPKRTTRKVAADAE